MILILRIWFRSLSLFYVAKEAVKSLLSVIKCLYLISQIGNICLVFHLNGCSKDCLSDDWHFFSFFQQRTKQNFEFRKAKWENWAIHQSVKQNARNKSSASCLFQESANKNRAHHPVIIEQFTNYESPPLVTMNIINCILIFAGSSNIDPVSG